MLFASRGGRWKRFCEDIPCKKQTDQPVIRYGASKNRLGEKEKSAEPWPLKTEPPIGDWERKSPCTWLVFAIIHVTVSLMYIRRQWLWTIDPALDNTQWGGCCGEI